MLAKSRRDPSSSLRLLSQRIGKLREYRPVRDPGKVLAVGVGGGLPPEGLRYVVNVDYTASFEKVPDARLRIQFVDGQAGWQVGDFSFGVPRSQPNAQELIADVLRVLQQVLQQ